MKEGTEIKKIIVRAYGILIDDQKRVLVSDEIIKEKFYTKFPGGGLELGEGIRDCLIREFKEETGLDITVDKHFYTTDFFQQSAFNATDQIISIYYFVLAENLSALKTKNKVFDFSKEQITNISNQTEVFRWIDWDELTEKFVSLPIDKIVVNLLKEH